MVIVDLMNSAPTVPSTSACAHDGGGKPTQPAALGCSDAGPSASVRYPAGESGLYGPRGWSVDVGMWKLLEPCVDLFRTNNEDVMAALLAFAWENPDLPAEDFPSIEEILDGTIPGIESQRSQPIEDGVPVQDYTPLHNIGSYEARELLGMLPSDVLTDRHNLSPSLARLLRVCAGASGKVRLSGYGIGPQRSDERISIDGMWIDAPECLELLEHEEHSPRCDCVSVWKRLKKQYWLDAEGIPDEIQVMPRHWDRGPLGIWLWWD